MLSVEWLAQVASGRQPATKIYLGPKAAVLTTCTSPISDNSHWSRIFFIVL